MTLIRANNRTLSDVTAAGIPKSAGQVLQVKSATKTDKQSTTSNSYSDVTGLSVTITPSSANSKIYVMVHVVYGGGDNSYGAFRLMRDTTHISKSTYATGNQVNASFTGNMETASHITRNAACNFLDSPATTSAVTYKVQFAQSYSSYNMTINAPHQTDNYSYNIGHTSSITVMEIAG